MALDRSTDARIAALATPQGGYIHRDQLRQLSLAARAIRYRVERGLLIPAYYNVFAVGHEPTDPISRAKGALLAAGPRSALDYDSAASFYGIHKRWHGPLHITVPTDRRIHGLIIHRNRRLLRSDVLTPELNLRVVSPVIALLHVAPDLTPKRVNRAANELRLERHISLQQISATIERFPRHPGVHPLRSVLGASQSQPTRSSWEDEWPAFAFRHALPPYAMNVHVSGYRVDVLFTSEQLIVELDGWATHQTHAAFIADRHQDAEILARTGIPTVRITYERFHRQAAQEAVRLQAILARRTADLRGAG